MKNKFNKELHEYMCSKLGVLSTEYILNLVIRDMFNLSDNLMNNYNSSDYEKLIVSTKVFDIINWYDKETVIKIKEDNKK